MDFEPPDPKRSPATAAPVIDVGLAKTHARCLPCDIEFVPYRVDNMVFHFPLPPASKPSSAKHAPANSAIYFHSHDKEPIMPSEVDRKPKDERKNHRKTRVISAKVEIPTHTSSLQPFDLPLPSYEEPYQNTNQSTYYTNFQRQETLKKLEDNTLSEPIALHSDSMDTRPQLVDVPRSRHREAIIDPPPAHAAPQGPLREDMEPDSQRSSSALRRRTAILHHRQLQEQSARRRSINKSQVVLGLYPKQLQQQHQQQQQQQQQLLQRRRSEKSAIKHLFDHAVLDFQQQAPRTSVAAIAAAATTTAAAEKTTQRNEPIGARRWTSRTQRRIVTGEQTFYTPGSVWRPTAKVHRGIVDAWHE